FAPAAKPYHLQITSWQREFQKIIGKSHSRYFNKNNWLYFTKEHFDLLYPGYGDTYPIYNGAIGMTYEKAGGAAGGISAFTSDGDTLTLHSRIKHHHTTGLSTVESAYKHKDRIIKEFRYFFTQGIDNPVSKYKSFVIKVGLNDPKREDLLSWLDTHGIKYGHPIDDRPRSVRGYSYGSGEYDSFRIQENDIIISSDQKKSVLAQVLFEPKTHYEDSLTYDITAWSIPYVYGLEAYALETVIKQKSFNIQKGSKIIHNWDDSPYAYLNPWNSVYDLKFLSEVLKNKIVVRVSEEPFEINGMLYDRGTLVITRKGNESMGQRFDKVLRKLSKKYNTNLGSVSTGLVTKGKDFGSSTMRVVNAPKVAVLSGEDVSSYSFGEVWHYFEQQIGYPLSVYDASTIQTLPLDNIDVLIMPNGSYNSFVNENSPSEKIKEETDADVLLINQPPEELLDWVRSGGRLIAIGSAMEKFVDENGYGLVRYESKESKKAAQELKKKRQKENRLKKYKDKNRSRLSDASYGSIIRVDVDNTHPLMYGYGKKYFSLRQRSRMYPYLPKGWNVGTIKNSSSHVSGFMGYRVKQKIKDNLIFGVHENGKGRIIYLADNPLFRGFWYSGKLLFGNAVFMVGS
ncbi:MAG: zinc carboxypeptidase, partial [Candidatus Neomarinimicrobiota bacterium]|nr:zinc carboxypeptidase [Candidatus Neomarinimicrobiota bacterium]